MNEKEILNKMLNLFDTLGLDEKEFFNLIHGHPNVHTTEDLILIIKNYIEKGKKTHAYEHIINIFKLNKGFSTANMLKQHNISSYQIKKLEELGEIVRLKRGLYALSEIKYNVDEIVEVSLLVPRGVLCLYSALAHHELSTYTPGEYNIAISRKERKPALPDYPPIRVFSFDDSTFEMGIEEIDKDGHSIKIYNRERTICDIVKYRNKLDSNVVKEALNNYSKSKKKDYTKILHYAEKMRVKSIMMNYLEVL